MASIYKQSMALQAELDVTTKNKSTLANLGLAVINKQWDGSLTRAAHSSEAYFIDDGLTTESYVYPTQKFGEVVVKGLIPRVTCVNISERLVVSIPFFDAVVLGPAQEIEPELLDYELEECTSVLPLGVRMDRPLHTPVENLGFIILAA